MANKEKDGELDNRKDNKDNRYNDFNNLTYSHNEPPTYATLYKRYKDEDYNSSFINGISKKRIKFGDKYNQTLIDVPYEVSSNGKALITFQNYNVVSTKNKDYVNLRFPDDYQIKTKIKDREGKNDDLSLTADELNGLRFESQEQANRKLDSIIFDFSDVSAVKFRLDFGDYCINKPISELQHQYNGLNVQAMYKGLDMSKANVFARVSKDYCLPEFNDKMKMVKGKNYCFELGSLSDAISGEGFTTCLPLSKEPTIGKDNLPNNIQNILDYSTSMTTLCLGNQVCLNQRKELEFDGDYYLKESHSDVVHKYKIPVHLATRGLGSRFRTQEDAMWCAEDNMSQMAAYCINRDKSEGCPAERFRSTGADYFIVHDESRNSMTLCAGPRNTHTAGNRVINGIPVYEGAIVAKDGAIPSVETLRGVCLKETGKDGRTKLVPVEDVVPLVEQKVCKDGEKEHEKVREKMGLEDRIAEAKAIKAYEYNTLSDKREPWQKKRKIPERLPDLPDKEPELEI